MKFAKKITEIATCMITVACMTANMSANASFYATPLSVVGTIPALNHTIVHMARIDITNGVVTAISNAYERNGKPMAMYSVHSHVDLYRKSNGQAAWVDGIGAPYGGGKKLSVSVSANVVTGYTYYCEGHTIIDSNYDGVFDVNNGDVADTVLTGEIS